MGGLASRLLTCEACVRENRQKTVELGRNAKKSTITLFATSVDSIFPVASKDSGGQNPYRTAGHDLEIPQGSRTSSGQERPDLGVQKSEGLKTARLFMVIGSISPLFVIWAIRGAPLIPDRILIPACAAAVVVPNALLLTRFLIAKHQLDTRPVVVGRREDIRSHLLVYLFAMLLPLYALDFNSWRDISAAIVAVAFIIVIFYYFNLHYMNVAFAAFSYRVFTVYAPDDSNPATGRMPLILITKRIELRSGDTIVAYRLSDSVFLE